MTYLDSRELQERLEELEDMAEENEIEEDDQEELFALLELKKECEHYGWDYGITFIPEYEWKDYATELFDDCYDVPENISSYIDYDSFASDLEQDYSIVTFQDEDYYYREA